MWRKIFLSLLSLLFITTLASCKDKAFFIPQNNVNVNYNNDLYGSWFSITEDTVYCVLTPGFSSHYCSVSADGLKRISTLLNSYRSTVRTFDNKIILCEEGEQINEQDSNYRIRLYDKKKNKEILSEKVVNAENIYFLGDKIYYLQKAHIESTGEFKAISLNKEKNHIATDVIAIGVINNAPAYIVRKQNTLVVYQCDVEKLESHELSRFDYNSDSEIEHVNFTNDKIIIGLNNDSGLELFCYDINSKSSKKYSYNGYLFDIVAHDKYAFMNINIDEDRQTNVVCRVELESGKSEEIVRFNNLISMFVTSDDDVYVSSLEESNDYIYRVSANGEKELVCSLK